MKTKEEILQHIKDEVAMEYGWRNWLEYENLLQYSDTPDVRDISLIDEVIDRYTIVMCDEQNKECAVNATLLIERVNKSKAFRTGQTDYFAEEDDHIEVDRLSILNTKNVSD